MNILGHRGLWKEPLQKNSKSAFSAAFEAGFGIETDLRDSLGELVVSHDPPLAEELTAQDLFELHRLIHPSATLALNVKADGLQQIAKELIEKYEIEDYFFFDMSLPDALIYLRMGLRVFTRHSEEEPECFFYDRCDGVWLDAFYSDWYSSETISRHLDSGKKICIVSSEIHGRDHRPVWDMLEAEDFQNEPSLMLCTDYPEDALAQLGGAEIK